MMKSTLYNSLRKSQSTIANRAILNVQVRNKYSDRVIDHYNNPRNVGSLDKLNMNVGSGLVGAPACGDVLKLQIEVEENTGVIRDAKFRTFGCGSAIASSSFATELVKGKTVDECLAIKNQDIAHHLALPPVKLHCSMLAEDAIKAAVYDYKKKQDQRKVAFEQEQTTQQQQAKQ